MNTLTFFLNDLSNYSDSDLYKMASFLNIKNPSIYNRNLLKLKLATIQFNNIFTSNLDINIPTRGLITISDTCLKGYEIQKILGSGTYGSVHSALDSKDYLNPNKKYAVKFQNLYVDKNKYSTKNYNIQKDFLIKNFTEEAKISQLLNDYNIGPKIYDAWICTSVEIGITVTELWDSTLEEKDLCTLDPNLIQKLRNQINEMHKYYYIHYDIKPDNILVKKDKNGTIIDLTLADFGLTSKNINTSITPEIFYNYHSKFAPNFYKQVTLEDVKKNPYLFDYGLLYEIQICNPNVKQISKYPIELIKK